ncbi:hypothetical protein B296_00014497 [Ensete ventricosum]|uniref:Uncharacterized protein n=1 Tax=Ensete ventricosum TaxID=4639 RepID=A0A426ZN47_ENSVE|nr:hypothetical protein B296_00014497 [Ensete ventricosum]
MSARGTWVTITDYCSDVGSGLWVTPSVVVTRTTQVLGLVLQEQFDEIRKTRIEVTIRASTHVDLGLIAWDSSCALPESMGKNTPPDVVTTAREAGERDKHDLVLIPRRPYTELEPVTQCEQITNSLRTVSSACRCSFASRVHMMKMA